MAARSDAAAALGPKDGAFMSFNVVCSSPNSVNLQLTHKEITPKHIYDRQSLLDIGNAYKHQLSTAATEKLRGLCLLLEPDLETAASPAVCEVSTVLSAAGVHSHCYCHSLHSPCANAKDSLRELYSAISEEQTNSPDGFFIIAGDFNHANLKTVLPKFYQHVNFSTRGNNTLNIVYTTVKNAYKLYPAPTSGTRITSLLC